MCKKSHTRNHICLLHPKVKFVLVGNLKSLNCSNLTEFGFIKAETRSYSSTSYSYKYFMSLTKRGIEAAVLIEEFPPAAQKHLNHRWLQEW